MNFISSRWDVKNYDMLPNVTKNSDIISKITEISWTMSCYFFVWPLIKAWLRIHRRFEVLQLDRVSATGTMTNYGAVSTTSTSYSNLYTICRNPCHHSTIVIDICSVVFLSICILYITDIKHTFDNCFCSLPVLFNDQPFLFRKTGAVRMKKSIFCICPPAENTAAGTKRFYDAILSGCVPATRRKSKHLVIAAMVLYCLDAFWLWMAIVVQWKYTIWIWLMYILYIGLSLLKIA